MSKNQKQNLMRIIISAVLLIVTFVVNHTFETVWYISLLTFLVPYFIIGYDVIAKSLRNISHGQIFDENFLMSLATVGALATGEYPEAVFVMLFYKVGEFFEDWAVGKSRRSISKLMDIRPDSANLIKEGEIVTVDPYDVAVGDIILVKPGEKIPLDGEVIEGSSTVDTAALTGEALPRDISVGDRATSGCVNLSGIIKVRVESEFEQSTVSKILELIEDSSSNKAASEDFITKFARYYTPIVVFSAVALAFIPPIFVGQLKMWLMRALTFLVISCPCALVISIPLSFFGGIGGASKKGILIKGSCYLENLSKAEIAVFDKTGTLTKGIFSVTAVHPVNISENELIKYAAFAEYYSDHPIACSVKAFYSENIDAAVITDTQELAGHGIMAKISGHTVLAGNKKLCEMNGICPADPKEIGTILHICVDGTYAGYIVISDTLKEHSEDMIKTLKTNGIKTVMLTGDRDEVGKDIAEKLGLDEVHTELLPTDKVDIVEKLFAKKSKKGKLIFSGDGLNDAPVLARADIGIAMGGIGSDASIEAADIVIMDDDIGKIGSVLDISKRTLKIVKENIVFALGIKLSFLMLGAFGITTMWMAVFADVGVSVIAILNSMRTLKRK